jgi:cephalosporin-C deacetylase-like acetyl esterase
MYYRVAAIFLSIALTATASYAQTENAFPPPTSEAGPQPKSSAPAIENVSSEESEPEEDWSTIYLSKSGLPLKDIGGIVLSKAELQGCTRELVRLQWRQLDPIDLYVIRPKGTTKPPVVLFLHNYTSTTDIFRKDRWCETAKQNGFAIAGFGSALSWQRFHTPRTMGEWFVSELQEVLASTTHDVQMILNYLESRGDLDMQHVGMFGQGSGGAIAILAAAADSRIRVLDLMDPWGDWPDWLKESKQIPEEERATYLKPEFLQKISGLDPISYLPRLEGRAIRIHQVLADPITPDSAKNKIINAAPSTDVVQRYPDLSAEVKALGNDGIVAWLREQLRSQHQNTEEPRRSSLEITNAQAGK